ncbi:MAG: S-layer homology domain-containing protein [Bacillota bacterium]
MFKRGDASRVLAALLVALVAVLPLGLGPSHEASAATLRVVPRYFSDAPDSAASAYSDVLGTLGVLRGEGGLGGRFRPQDPVTRTEFAVLLWRLLALDPATDLPDSATAGAAAASFSDYADIPDWARHAVGLCHLLGIVKGRPDGLGGLRFEPTAPVTGAEALAMVLRALRNDEAIVGGWPAGYIYRAHETGLLADSGGAGGTTAVQPLAPLNRGQAAYLLYNALYCRRGYSPDPAAGGGQFARPSIGARLTYDFMVLEYDGETKTIRTTGGRSVRLPPTLVCRGIGGVEDLVARQVVWVEGSGVCFVRPYGEGEVVSGALSGLEVSQDGRTVLGVRLADGRYFACAGGCLIELNARPWPFDPAALLPSAEVEVVALAGQAVKASILQENVPLAVVTSLRLSPSDTPGSGGRPRGGLELSIGAMRFELALTHRTSVTLNDDPASAVDLREGDVVSVATLGTEREALLIRAVRRQVTGTFTQWVDIYTLEGQFRHLCVETPDGRMELGFNPWLEDQLASRVRVGGQYTFSLDRAGRVAHVSPALPSQGEWGVARVLREVSLERLNLVTLEWLLSEVTLERPAWLAALPSESLVRFSVGPHRTLARMEPVPPAFFRVTTVAADLSSERLTVSREGRTWRVSVARVPVYILLGAGPESAVGPAFGLNVLSAGDVLWLDDPGRPTYVLLDLGG